jgi:hypothetical protein
MPKLVKGRIILIIIGNRHSGIIILSIDVCKVIMGQKKRTHTVDKDTSRPENRDISIANGAERVPSARCSSLVRPATERRVSKKIVR